MSHLPRPQSRPLGARPVPTPRVTRQDQDRGAQPAPAQSASNHTTTQAGGMPVTPTKLGRRPRVPRRKISGSSASLAPVVEPDDLVYAPPNNVQATPYPPSPPLDEESVKKLILSRQPTQKEVRVKKWLAGTGTPWAITETQKATPKTPGTGNAKEALLDGC